MPLYEYVCRECGQPFEKLLLMSQVDEVQTCPNCGAADTGRQVSSFAVGGASNGSAALSAPVSSPFT
jgi:putative FmdB family regulatory protein